MEQQNMLVTLFISIEERAQLVRLCATLTGTPEIAEDLAQETLLEAWRHEQALRDPSKRLQWLAGIARNICLRWQRKHTRELAHRYQPDILHHEQDETDPDELFIDNDDIELHLERRELLELLDRALSLLPIETRTALIQHYINDSPLAELAQQLGTNTNALAVRLQRGKLALRHILTQDMQQELTAHHQLAESATWEATPLWCYYCGKQHLLGKRDPIEGKLQLKCPECSPGDRIWLSNNDHLPVLQGVKSYKPMLARLRQWCHHHYRTALTAYFNGGTILCDTCGQPLTVLLTSIEQLPDWLQNSLWHWKWPNNVKLLNTFCPRCQTSCNTTLPGLVLTLPEARAFAHTHPRLRTLPTQSLETQGRPALLTRIESITDTASLIIISDEETYSVLRIEPG